MTGRAALGAGAALAAAALGATAFAPAGAGAAARGAVPAGRPAPLVAFAGGFVRGRTEAQRTASYRRLRAMGVRAIRIDFRWIEVEPVGAPLHDYRWRALDSEVRAIRRADLKVLGILDYGHPDYSRAGGEAYRRGQQGAPPFGVGDPQYFPVDDPRSFARYAAAVARRYRGQVIGWEVWNEENGGWRFWEPKEDPLAYGRLLCATNAALKRVDRNVPVVFGGLFFPPLGGKIGTGGARFLAQTLDRGGRGIGACFDAVAYHPYPYPFTSPEAQAQDRGSVAGAASQLRSVLQRRGLRSKALWNTEVGWPTNPRGNGVTEARQARYAARLQLLSWALRVPVLTWYAWGDYSDPGDQNQEAHFGFFRADASAKPARRALVVLKRELGGRGWRYVANRTRALGMPRGRRGVGEGFALEFLAPRGRRLVALWYANERPPAGSNPFARVEPGTPPRSIAVRMRPDTASGVRVVDVLGRRVPVLRTRGGNLHLRVGQDPLYVAWRAG